MAPEAQGLIDGLFIRTWAKGLPRSHATERRRAGCTSRMYLKDVLHQGLDRKARWAVEPPFFFSRQISRKQNS